MADPLSIASSIAGIVTLADVVFLRLYKYAKAAKNSPQDVKDLASEVETVRDLLRKLSSVASLLESTPVATTFDLTYVKICEGTLQRIEDGLRKAEADFQRTRFRRFQRRLKWPFSAPETRDLLNSLARQKGNIGLSLGADCVSLVLSGLPKVNRIESSVAQISTEIQSLSFGVHSMVSHARLVDPYFKRVVLESFMETDHQARLDEILTCPVGDFPSHAPRWFDSPGLTLQSYGNRGEATYIHGPIREAFRHRSEEIAVAYCHVEFGQGQELSFVSILGSLVAQLASQSHQAYECVQRYYKQLHPLQSEAQVPTMAGLVALLGEVLPSFEQTYIIVDWGWEEELKVGFRGCWASSHGSGASVSDARVSDLLSIGNCLQAMKLRDALEITDRLSAGLCNKR